VPSILLVALVPLVLLGLLLLAERLERSLPAPFDRVTGPPDLPPATAETRNE
jgi:hypothetical protein